MTEFKVENNVQPPDISKKKIDYAVDLLGKDMSIDIGKLVENPEDGKDWSLTDYLACVTYSPEDINETTNILGFEFKDIPDIKNLNPQEVTEPKTKVLLLLTTEAMLNTAIKGFENDSEEYSLKELIDDVHPSWKKELNSYRDDIRKTLYEVNNSEDSKRSLLEDIGKALDISGNKRKAYSTLAVIAIASVGLTSCIVLSSRLLSSYNEIEAVGSINTESPIDEPKATAIYTPTPLEPTQTSTPEPTPTNTVEPSNTPTPTEEHYSSEYYTGQEELDKFGYVIWHSQKRSSPESGWVIMSFFTYEKYSRTTEGIYIHGNYSFQEEDYSIKIKIDPDESFHITGSNTNDLEDVEDIEKWYNKNTEYLFFAFPTRKDNDALIPVPSESPDDDVWREYRELFHDLLINGGENDNYYLALIQTKRNRD